MPNAVSAIPSAAAVVAAVATHNSQVDTKYRKKTCPQILILAPLTSATGSNRATSL